MPVLVGLSLADNTDRRVTVLLQQDHAGNEMGVEREDEVVGQQVVRMVLQVVHDEDVARALWQQTLTEDSVCGICEQFLEFN